MTPTIDINFQVLNTNDPSTILIADQSQWGVSENKPAYLIVTPPGSKNTINLNFPKERIMILTSIALGLSEACLDCTGQKYDDLDDGIWEFCLQSAFEGLNKKRFYLKDDQLRQQIAKIRIRLYDTQGLTFVRTKASDEIAIMENMLDVANDLTMEGRTKDAMKAYNEASKIAERYENCKNCM